VNVWILTYEWVRDQVTIEDFLSIHATRDGALAAAKVECTRSAPLEEWVFREQRDSFSFTREDVNGRWTWGSGEMPVMP
jgi:hypothetical protein